MSTDKQQQEVLDGYEYLREKIESAKALVREIQSQGAVLLTAESELTGRQIPVAETVTSIMDDFRQDISAALTLRATEDPVVMRPTESEIDKARDREIDALKVEAAHTKVQVEALKTSRDRLLFEIDRLSVELECAESSRLTIEKQEREQEKLAAYWKQQSTEKHRQIQRLKEMLDESAEACREGGLPEAEAFSEVAKAVDDRQRENGLMTQLVASEVKNGRLRDAWLPTLRRLEAKLMDLTAGAAEATD